MNRYIIGTMVVLLIVSASFEAWAMDESPSSGGHKWPPPEAIAACKDKNEGTAVEFTNRRGKKVKATCKQFNGQLVALPEGGFHRRHGTPSGGTQSGQ